MNIIEALRVGVAKLSNFSDAPPIDAERLLLFTFKKDEVSWLLAHGEESLTKQQEQTYQKLIRERKKGVPLAYLLGEWGFYGRTFFVTRDVLVPRPATEHLIDTALKTVNSLCEQLGRPLIVADVGTGGGCIAVTLALETSPAIVSTIYATDISPAALAIAKKNAKLHGVQDRIHFLEGNLLEPLRDKKIDLIVSNPPYIPTETLAKAGHVLETCGLQFEPQGALDGGPDGQAFIQKIASSSIPAIVEVTGGSIQTFHKKSPQGKPQGLKVHFAHLLSRAFSQFHPFRRK